MDCPSIQNRRLIQNLMIPFVLMLLAVIIRLALIGKGFYHPDCLFLGLQAQKILDTHQMHYLHLIGYPLTALLGAAFLKLGHIANIQNPAFSINLLSVAFSVLSLMLFYGIIQKMTDTLSAALSTTVLMLHPIFLAVSVFGNSHMPALFFFLLSLAGILFYREKGLPVILVASAVAAGLMAAARPQNLILVFPLGWLATANLSGLEARTAGKISWLAKLKISGLLFFISTAVLTCFYLPLLAGRLSSPSSGGHVQGLGAVIREVLGDMDPYALWVSTQSVFLSFSLPGAVLILMGLFLLYKHARPLFVFCLAWALIPLFLFGSLITTVARYYTHIVVAFSIPIGFALAVIIRRNQRWLFIGACLVFALILTANVTRIFPILLFRHQNDLMRTYGEWIKKQTEPQAVIFTHDDGLIVRHYANRQTRRIPFLKYASRIYTAADTRKLAEAQDFISERLAAGIPVYITSLALQTHDPEFRFRQMLRQNFRLTYVAHTIAEEWHQGAVHLLLFREELFKIEPRSQAQTIKSPSSSLRK